MKVFGKISFLIGSLLGLNAFAMPSDQPALRYFADGPVAVGLIYSAGADGSADPSDHRKLQEVYLCNAGRKVGDFFNFSTLVDEDGVTVEGKTVSGEDVVLEYNDTGVTVLSSTLAGLPIDRSNPASIAQTQSGILGFEIDLTNPCAPRAISQ